MPESPLIVLDTMIVVSGMIGQRSASDARTLDAVETGRVRLALSDAWLLELNDVVSRPFIQEKLPNPARVFRAALSLGLMGELYWPRRQDWPSLVDQKDWWALDLAWESEADFIVTRDKAILRAGKKLKLAVLEPPELLALLET